MPPEGNGSVQMPPELVLEVVLVVLDEPSAVSQYSPGLQSPDVWQSAPGVTHASERHACPVLQHVAPQTAAAFAQQTPLLQTPPLQSADVMHFDIIDLVEKPDAVDAPAPVVPDGFPPTPEPEPDVVVPESLHEDVRITRSAAVAAATGTASK